MAFPSPFSGGLKQKDLLLFNFWETGGEGQNGNLKGWKFLNSQTTVVIPLIWAPIVLQVSTQLPHRWNLIGNNKYLYQIKLPLFKCLYIKKRQLSKVSTKTMWSSETSNYQFHLYRKKLISSIDRVWSIKKNNSKKRVNVTEDNKLYYLLQQFRNFNGTINFSNFR